MTVGIIAEKPSAARNLAAALGGMRGTLDGESYVIAAARGHLYEYAKGPERQLPAGSAEAAAASGRWSIESLPWDERSFSWRRVPSAGAKPVIDRLRATLSGCEEIAIATDVDASAEGQLIGWEIIEGCGLAGRRVTRMYFTDEAPATLRAAFSDRRELPAMEDDPDYRKAAFRSRWDYLSMQWTRLVTVASGGGRAIRCGRLKSAMVTMVADQLDAVAAYRRVPSYQMRFRDENGVIYTDPERPVRPTREEVAEDLSASPVVVDEVARRRSAPPALMDLAAISAALAPRGVPARRCLDLYQKMYEDCLLSYPRTDDRRVTPAQFDELLARIDEVARVAGVDPAILTHREPRSTHVSKSCTHGANRPGSRIPSSLSDLDARYGDGAGAVWRACALSYLTMLADDCVWDAQTGHVRDHPTFIGRARVPVSPGWRAVAGDLADATDDSAGLGREASPFVHEGFPPKPPAPTQRWLMRQLERRRVGTGATRTSTYADVTSPSGGHEPLLADKRGRISMAPAGETCHRLLPGTRIGDIDVTEHVFDEMDRIRDGALDAETALAEVAEMVRLDIPVVRENARRSGMVESERAEGTWRGRRVGFKRTWSSHRFDDDEIARLLAGERIVIDCTFKSGSSGRVEGELAEQTYKGRRFIGFKRTKWM